MGMTDNKVLGWNINLGQFLGLIAIATGVVLAVWTDSLIIGYVVMTLALCAFFLVVAFDVGAPKRASRNDATGTDAR
jgi:hypothetical protein